MILYTSAELSNTFLIQSRFVKPATGKQLSNTDQVTLGRLHSPHVC